MAEPSRSPFLAHVIVQDGVPGLYVAFLHAWRDPRPLPYVGILWGFKFFASRGKSMGRHVGGFYETCLKVVDIIPCVPGWHGTLTTRGAEKWLPAFLGGKRCRFWRRARSSVTYECGWIDLLYVEDGLSQQPHFVTRYFTKHSMYEHSLCKNLSLLHISLLLFASVSSSVNGVTFLSLAI